MFQSSWWPAVRLMMLDVAEGTPVAAKPSVRLPMVPLIERLVKAATPDALVVAVAVPSRVPPPEATDAVTTTPGTGLLEASFTVTAGCCVRATPLCAELGGWVVMLS